MKMNDVEQAVRDMLWAWEQVVELAVEMHYPYCDQDNWQDGKICRYCEADIWFDKDEKYDSRWEREVQHKPGCKVHLALDYIRYLKGKQQEQEQGQKSRELAAV
jgi:hypothetical protein